MTNHYLFAFTGVENDADCTMALELSSALEIIEVETKSETKKAFAIRTLANIYFLRAENIDIMNKWKNELKKLIDNNKKTI